MTLITVSRPRSPCTGRITRRKRTIMSKGFFVRLALSAALMAGALVIGLYPDHRDARSTVAMTTGTLSAYP